MNNQNNSRYIKSKAKYWTVVMYPENMIDDWEDEIAELLQLPGSYCIHDKCYDKNRHKRKTHVHIIIVFNNTTTYNNVVNIFSRLEKQGCSAFNKVEPVIDIRHMYDYLIHNTDDSRKKKKHLYATSERIEFNNFDIGAYEQLSARDKEKMVKELCDYVVQSQVTNFTEFYSIAMTTFGDEYFEVFKTHSGLIERLTKGNYLKEQKAMQNHTYHPYQIGGTAGE